MIKRDSLLQGHRLEAHKIAQTILGANLSGFDPGRVPPSPEDMIDGADAWAERLAWLVLQDPEVLEARAAALVEYGESLPDGVTTEAFAEAPPSGTTRIGWRNLATGALNRGHRDPGYGWCPIYVDTVKVWIKP